MSIEKLELAITQQEFEIMQLKDRLDELEKRIGAIGFRFLIINFLRRFRRH
jgi:uncharacterized coiled-coil protein SlyX